MRKTSIVLMASIMAFAFLALIPQGVAVAEGECGACIVGPINNPSGTQYPRPSSTVWKMVGQGYTCASACQICRGLQYQVCIDKYGCGIYCDGCKGQPSMLHAQC